MRNTKFSPGIFIMVVYNSIKVFKKQQNNESPGGLVALSDEKNIAHLVYLVETSGIC